MLDSSQDMGGKPLDRARDRDGDKIGTAAAGCSVSACCGGLGVPSLRVGDSDFRFLADSGRVGNRRGESGHSRSLSDTGLLHIARGWLRVWLPVAAVASGPSGSSSARVLCFWAG